MLRSKCQSRSTSRHWSARADRFRGFISSARPHRFRRLALEQLEERQVLTLTLSIQASDSVMTEPDLYVNTSYPLDQHPSDIGPMQVPDKGVFTITRSGEDISNSLWVPIHAIGDYTYGLGPSLESNDGFLWSNRMADWTNGVEGVSPDIDGCGYNLGSLCALIPAGESSATFYAIPYSID